MHNRVMCMTLYILMHACPDEGRARVLSFQMPLSTLICMILVYGFWWVHFSLLDISTTGVYYYYAAVIYL